MNLDGDTAPDIQAQTAQALKNLESSLSSSSLDRHSIVKTTVFLTDMGDFEGMNQVYSEFFSGLSVLPARSTVAVRELPRVSNTPLLVEIEAVAYD